ATHRHLSSFPTRRSSDLIAVHGQRFPAPGIQNNEGNQLFRELKWTVVVRTVGCEYGQPVRVIVSPDQVIRGCFRGRVRAVRLVRSEEHTSELQSRENLVC